MLSVAALPSLLPPQHRSFHFMHPTHAIRLHAHHWPKQCLRSRHRHGNRIAQALVSFNLLDNSMQTQSARSIWLQPKKKKTIYFSSYFGLCLLLHRRRGRRVSFLSCWPRVHTMPNRKLTPTKLCNFAINFSSAWIRFGVIWNGLGTEKWTEMCTIEIAVSKCASRWRMRTLLCHRAQGKMNWSKINIHKKMVWIRDLFFSFSELLLFAFEHQRARIFVQRVQTSSHWASLRFR